MAEELEPGKKKAPNSLAQAESMVQLAMMLPAACCIGWFGGAALDKHFHTGWIAITGFLLGVAAGFVQIIKAVTGTPKRGG